MAEVAKGKFFDEFEIGATHATGARTLTEADIVNFAGLSGDFNPLHTDEEFARGTPFGRRIAHGMCVASIATGLANSTGIFEGTTIALMTMTINYKGPVFFGDTIRMVLRVTERKETKKPDRGVVVLSTEAINQRGETVIDGTWSLMMKRSQG